jgi:hypothetical protein
MFARAQTITAVLLMLSAAAAAPAYAQAMTAEDSERYEMLRQMDLYYQATEYLDGLFKRFSEGYIEADPALKKAIYFRQEYEKLARPVPERAKTLYYLTKELLAQVENYFIHFKRTNRESPEINMKIAGARIKLLQELDRLQYEIR